MGAFIFALIFAGIFFYVVTRSAKVKEPGKDAVKMLGLYTVYVVVGVIGFLILGAIILSLLP